MKLSILVPGIRTGKWERLYNSISDAFSGDWEIIFISPYELPSELAFKQNLKIIEDWGTPIRAQQRGLLEAKGDYIVWASDDGYFLKDSLNIGFKMLEGADEKTIVMGKYIEGENNGDYAMQSDKYYVLSNHKASKCQYIKDNYYMLNVGIVPRNLLLEVGGWDCQFEVCPMAYNDLAVRLQNYGVKFIIQNEIMFQCSHLPGHMGDHGPVHDAQIYHDEPLFKKIYNGDYNSPDRVKIDLDNWKNAPEKWERRFATI